MVLADCPKLLLVEDDPDTAGLIAQSLEDYFGPACVRVCPTVSDALTVDIGKIDLVLSDMNLPDGSGLDLLERFLDRRSDLPVVFVTGESVLENAVQAIRRGAYDYIVKIGEYLFGVPLMVEKNLAIWQTKQENLRLTEQLTRTVEQVKVKNKQLEKAVRQLETMAATDPLTSLANRRAFGEAMLRTFAEARRSRHDLACIMLDLDGFKQFNDTHGHQRGDDLLISIAALLQRCCRQSDVPGRFGGDEFVILLPQADEHTACQVAHRIQSEYRRNLSHASSANPTHPYVTMSMGLACLRPDDVDPEHLVARADHALYRAKQAGKNRLVIHRQMETAPASPAPKRVAI